MNPPDIERPPAFVISTGRCGSTFLSEVLNRHPGVLSVSEFLFSMEPDPFPAGQITSEALMQKLARKDPLVTAALRAHAEPVEFLYPVDAGKRWNRETGVPAIATIALPHLTDDPDDAFDDLVAFASSLPPAPIGRQYAAVFAWLTQRFDRRTWVERSGGSLYLVASLHEQFPDARFIHLFRDGRETAISMSKRDNFRLMLIGVEIQRLIGVNPYTVPDPPPFAALPEPFCRLAPDESFDLEALRSYPLPLERFGLHWSSSILRGLRQLSRVDPERVLSIAYEDLVTEPVEVTQAVGRFLNLAIDEEWTSWSAKAVTRQPSKWLALPEPDRERLDRACRMANARLYGSNGPPTWTVEELGVERAG